jgi:hypothetical protein
MLAARKGDFVQKQGLLRKILEELLVDYSDQHPWVIRIIVVVVVVVSIMI